MIDFQIYALDNMTVNEAVTENEDGSYTIFINADLCRDKQEKALYHAIRHIAENDFEKADVQQIEIRAHEGDI